MIGCIRGGGCDVNNSGGWVRKYEMVEVFRGMIM